MRTHETGGVRLEGEGVRGVRVTYDAEHGKEDDEGDREERSVCVGVDVRVATLVDLQHAQPRNHVHK